MELNKGKLNEYFIKNGLTEEQKELFTNVVESVIKFINEFSSKVLNPLWESIKRILVKLYLKNKKYLKYRKRVKNRSTLYNIRKAKYGE